MVDETCWVKEIKAFAPFVPKVSETDAVVFHVGEEGFFMKNLLRSTPLQLPSMFRREGVFARFFLHIRSSLCVYSYLYAKISWSYILNICSWLWVRISVTGPFSLLALPKLAWIFLPIWANWWIWQETFRFWKRLLLKKYDLTRLDLSPAKSRSCSSPPNLWNMLYSSFLFNRFVVPLTSASRTLVCMHLLV